MASSQCSSCCQYPPVSNFFLHKDDSWRNSIVANDCNHFHHELRRCALSTSFRLLTNWFSDQLYVLTFRLESARLNGLIYDGWVSLIFSMLLTKNVSFPVLATLQYSAMLAVLYAGYASAHIPSNIILQLLLAWLATCLDPTCVSPCWSGHLQKYDDPALQAPIPPSPPANMDELD